MKLAPLVYLDTGFVAMAYEDFTGKKYPAKITKSEDVTAGANAGFFHAGASTKELTEYPSSAYQMFQDIRSFLDSLPTCAISDDLSYPALFWTSGFLGVGSQKLTSRGVVKKEVHHFSLASNDSQPVHHLALVTNDIYFTPGYDQLAQFKDTLASSLWKPVRALVRTLYVNKHQDDALGAAMVILDANDRSLSGNVSALRYPCPSV